MRGSYSLRPGRPCSTHTSVRPSPRSILQQSRRSPSFRSTPCSHQHTDAQTDARPPASPSHEVLEGSERQRSTSSASSSKTREWPTATALTLLGVGGLLGTNFNAEGPLATLEAIAVLAAIVTVHECGHFLAARLQGIHVSKFAIGFGPELLVYQGDVVEYSLRLFPLGGYVAFPEEELEAEEGGEGEGVLFGAGAAGAAADGVVPPPEREPSPYDPDDPNLLGNRPAFDRAVVISAGVIANVIFAASILFAQVSLIGVPDPVFKPGVMVPSVKPGTVAYKSGIRSGDVITAVGDQRLGANARAVPQLVEAIKAHPQSSLKFDVDRKGELLSFDIYPDVAPDGGGRVGVQLSANAQVLHRRVQGMEIFRETAQEFNRLLGNVTGGLKQIFTNFASVSDSVSGPLAIVAVGADVARQDSTGLYMFAAAVNLNLAVVNVLPLPALDGGYLLLIIVEILRGGQKLPRQLEGAIMASGLLLLLSSGLFLIARDAINITVASGLLPQ